jgi:hypothetical protein
LGGTAEFAREQVDGGGMRRRRLVALVLPVLAIAGCGSSATKLVDRSVPSPSPSPVIVMSPSPVQAAGAQRPTEACAQLTRGADGDASPTVCPDGRANVHAVDMYRDWGSLTINLGPVATADEVGLTLCLDYKTGPITRELYATARALNGWNFAVDPLGAIDNCTGTLAAHHLVAG